jgi:hypothetical protein
MRTKFLLAALIASGGLAAMQGSAYAQATSAFPQSLSPSYDQAVPGSDYYGAQGSPRYYNEVPAQQSNAARSHHRASAQH